MRLFAGVVAASLLFACADPARRADSLAQHLGFHKEIVAGRGFRHVLYSNSAPVHQGALHVYIEGDGTPYQQPTTVAIDPTPRNPLMLRLMALDTAASIYVGRPCYFGLVRDAGCSPAYWTNRRYGPEVLDSMQAVIRSEAAMIGATGLQIYGFSGGGNLAILLAQRIDAVTRVVTMGANLDLTAWCDLHHYSPLVGSVSPVDQGPARATLDVLHLVGENDTNAPPAMVLAAARKRGGETVRVVKQFDHACCWESVWRDIVSLDAAIHLP